MSDPAPNAPCPQCHAPLSADAPQGLCLHCLLTLGAAGEESEVGRQETGSRGQETEVRSEGFGGRSFGDFEILEELGRGGMGVVFKARQKSLGRIVALKTLRVGEDADKDLAQRLRAEASAAASLHHPHIVAIHEVGAHDGQPYFAMQFIDGQNLARVNAACEMRDAAWIRRAARWVRTVAEAIHHAHEHGILHRDLKPSNILIDALDEPRITDFGLAKRLAHESDLTLSGQVLGSPNYMPPEQAMAQRGKVGRHSDVYSLGAILYHLLTGRPPCVGLTLAETLQEVLTREPIAPRLLNPAVPRDLETLCLKCLEKESDRRYPTAELLALELDRFLKDEPIQARPVGRTEKAWRWCRRKPALAASFSFILVLLLIVIIGSPVAVYRINRERQRAEENARSETAQRQRAEDAVTLLELQRAEDLLEKDEITMGLAWLARIVRQQPTNRLAAQRLLSALTQRNFALPVGPRLQHGGRVFQAEFSPDGRRIVTASADLTARVWEAATGDPVGSPMVHGSLLRNARFSSDGGRLLTTTDGFRAHLWEVASGRALGKPMAHTKRIRSAEFSADGLRVLTASDDHTARVWNAQTGEPLLEPFVHQGPVLSARFSPNDRQIITASADSTAQLWDALTGRAACAAFRHESGVAGAEFSPDGKRLVTFSEDLTSRVWDLGSGELLSKPLRHAQPLLSAGFSPDGERIITVPKSGPARIWTARNWTRLAQPLEHSGTIDCAEFGPEAQRLLTGSSDHTARLWDAETGQALSAPMQHDGMVRSAHFSPDGRFAVTASADKTARVWDVRPGGARSEPLRRGGAVGMARFSPDGEWILTGAVDGTAQLWNSRTGQPHGPVMQHAGWVHDAAFSPDGQRIAIGSKDGTARIWDTLKGQPLTGPLLHDTPVDRLQFSPDGRTLASSSWTSNNIVLWNVETGERRGEPIRHPGDVHVLSFSPDGSRLLSDDFRNNRGQIRDVETRRLTVELRGHEGSLEYGEFSPDGRRVLTASEDGTARIWDAQTGRSLTEPLRHKGKLRTARFSPDGRRIVTASLDSTAQVWDAQTGQPVGEALRHRKQVNTAEFSPDGLLVVTASNDRTSRLWDVATGRPVSESFEDRGVVVSARFSPDGRRVLTASSAGNAQVWDVPPRIVELPHSKSEEPTAASFAILLAEVVDTILGKRVTAQGSLENIPSKRLDELRQRLGTLPREGDAPRWLEWFLADRSTRSISPASPIAMPDYIWSRAKETNEFAWREALMLCPDQRYAFAQLARHYLQLSKSQASSEAGLADWNSRRSVGLASMEWSSWHQRANVLEHTGQWTNLLAEAAREIQINPNNPYAWNARGRAFAELRQVEAALDAWTHALEIGDREKRFQTEPLLRREIQRNRAAALRQFGRTADRLAALEIPPRAAATSDNLIDLSAFYNAALHTEFHGGNSGNHLGEFSTGQVRLKNVDFDLRGIVHLAAPLPEIDYPKSVLGISVNVRCRRLQFLHTAGWGTEMRMVDTRRREHLIVPHGTVIGTYQVHYADGQNLDIPIVYGRDTRDWWHYAENSADEPALVTAWEGTNPASRAANAAIRLFLTTWVNPRPDVPIRSFDFIHAGTRAVPILVAVTAE